MVHTQQNSKRLRWLIPVALLFTGVVFGSRYLKFPLAAVGQAGWLGGRVGRPLTLIYMGLYPIDLLFTRLPVYLALSALAVAVTVAALVLARPGKLARAALLLGLVGVLALPFVYRYQPAVTVDGDGARATIPTQPGPLAGVVKAVQAGAEVRRCDYVLLGWSESGALYGEEICDSNRRFWACRPAADRRLQKVDSVPANLTREAISREELQAEGVGSQIPQDETLRLVVRDAGLGAPRGDWVAFVARHVYGPEDVVVVRR